MILFVVSLYLDQANGHRFIALLNKGLGLVYPIIEEDDFKWYLPLCISYLFPNLLAKLSRCDKKYIFL